MWRLGYAHASLTAALPQEQPRHMNNRHWSAGGSWWGSYPPLYADACIFDMAASNWLLGISGRPHESSS